MANSALKDKLSATLTSFRGEVSSIRTGRASTALVENLKVEAYEGTPPMTLRELATISVPEPRLIIIDPWDKTLTQKIEKALQTAPGLGVSPVVDQQVIRLPLPSLSEERRRETVKLLKATAEKYRQQMRDGRQVAIKEVEGQESKKLISEDEKFALKKQIEEAMHVAGGQLDDLVAEKEAEILKI